MTQDLRPKWWEVDPNHRCVRTQKCSGREGQKTPSLHDLLLTERRPLRGQRGQASPVDTLGGGRDKANETHCRRRPAFPRKESAWQDHRNRERELGISMQKPTTCFLTSQ